MSDESASVGHYAVATSCLTLFRFGYYLAMIWRPQGMRCSIWDGFQSAIQMLTPSGLYLDHICDIDFGLHGISYQSHFALNYDHPAGAARASYSKLPFMLLRLMKILYLPSLEDCPRSR
jgi:hypothetical protein